MLYEYFTIIKTFIGHTHKASWSPLPGAGSQGQVLQRETASQPWALKAGQAPLERPRCPKSRSYKRGGASGPLMGGGGPQQQGLLAAVGEGVADSLHCPQQPPPGTQSHTWPCLDRWRWPVASAWWARPLLHLCTVRVRSRRRQAGGSQTIPVQISRGGCPSSSAVCGLGRAGPALDALCVERSSSERGRLLPGLVAGPG